MVPAHPSAPTYQGPLSDADPHTVDRAGGELGPVGQLAVVLAGLLTGLRDAGRGLGQRQTVAHLSLAPVPLEAGRSCRTGQTAVRTLTGDSQPTRGTWKVEDNGTSGLFGVSLSLTPHWVMMAGRGMKGGMRR